MKTTILFHKVKNQCGKYALSWMSFIILGIAATVWFLFRVISKPQRATYQCMRAAAPFMSAFVIYLITFSGSFLAFRKAKFLFRRSKYFYAFTFILLATISALLFLTGRIDDVYASSVDNISVMPNAPIGVEKGIFPGRVAWVFGPGVAAWDGSKLKSLGVMEHWNNSTDKKYSRNLGKNYGIELVYLPINTD